MTTTDSSKVDIRNCITFEIFEHTYIAYTYHYCSEYLSGAIYIASTHVLSYKHSWVPSPR